MVALSVDTSMSGIGVALYGGQVSQCAYRRTPRGQAEFLVPMVKDLLSGTDLSFQDIAQIIVPLGPGSFTGLRIGLSAALAWQVALDVPVYGVSTLQCLALQYVGSHAGDQPIAVLIETKRSDYYVQIFDGQGAPLSEAEALDAEEMTVLLAKYSNAVLIGDAVARYDGTLAVDEAFTRLDALFLAKLYSNQPDLFTDTIEPFYLRGADVSVSKRKARVLEA